MFEAVKYVYKVRFIKLEAITCVYHFVHDWSVLLEAIIWIRVLSGCARLSCLG
jgi:hypothetical protein